MCTDTLLVGLLLRAGSRVPQSYVLICPARVEQLFVPPGTRYRDVVCLERRSLIGGMRHLLHLGFEMLCLHFWSILQHFQFF